MLRKSGWKPSEYFKKGRIGLIPTLLLTIIAFLLLPKLGISYEVIMDGSAKDPYLEKIREEKGGYLDRADFIFIAAVQEAPFSENSLNFIHKLTRELEQMPGVELVLSPVNLQEIFENTDELEFRPIAEFPLTRESRLDFTRRMSDTHLFRKLFYGKNLNNGGIYIFSSPKTSPENLAENLIQWSEKEYRGKLHLSGYPVITAYSRRIIHHDTWILILLSFILLLVSELILYRNIKAAFLLCLASLIPAVWSLGLFPILGAEISMDSISVPVIVLGLSTSYGIHLFRYRRLRQKETIPQILNEVSPKILLAGLTTMLGFSSLLFSPSPSIQRFGLTILLGVLFALLFSLYALPYLSRNIILKNSGLNIYPKRTLSGIHINAFLGFLALALILLGAGFNLIRQDGRLERILLKNHPYQTSLHFFNDEYGGINEIEIFIDTGEEYGLTNPLFFENLYLTLNGIKNLNESGAVISYIDFVDWIDSRLGGPGVSPENIPDEMIIGESLELLSGQKTAGLDIGSMITPDFSRTRISLLYSNNTGSTDSFSLEDYTSRIDKEFAEFLPGIEYTLSGTAIVSEYLFSYQRETIFRGMIFFFPLLLLILLLTTRSPAWTATVLLAPVVGTFVYFGTMGWLGIPLSSPTLICITCVLGVSVDDAVFLTFSLRENLKELPFRKAVEVTYEQTGGAVIETTMIIIIVISCFFFSNARGLRYAGFLVILSQSASTAYTLFLLPLLQQKIIKKPGVKA